MRITVEKKDLAARLAVAGRLASGKQPGYRAVLLRAAEGEVRVLATDGGLDYVGGAPATVDEPGEIAVCGKLLADLVKRLPDWPLELSLDDAGSLVLRAERLSYTLAPEAAAKVDLTLDLPKKACDLDAGLLLEAIDRTLFCVARNGDMEAINCLLLEPRDGGALAVALNGHNAARAEVRDPGLAGLAADKGLLLQRAHVEELRDWLPASGVQAALEKKRLVFRAPDEALSVPLATYEYPNHRGFWSRLESAVGGLDAGREALLAALARMELFTTGELSAVVFDCSAQGVTLSVRGDNAKAREGLVADFRGEPLRLSFPVKGLAKVLRNLKSESVRMNFCGREAPCGVTGLDDADDGYGLLIMPMIAGEED